MSNTYEEVLNSVGILSVLTKGTSMQPLLISGRDTVIIRKNATRLNKYDIALYNRNGKYVLHRVMKVLDSGYIFCGDNHAYLETVEEGQILGVAEGRYIGEKYKEFKGFRYKLYLLIWCKSLFVRKILLFFKSKLFKNLGSEYQA